MPGQRILLGEATAIALAVPSLPPAGLDADTGVQERLLPLVSACPMVIVTANTLDWTVQARELAAGNDPLMTVVRKKRVVMADQMIIMIFVSDVKIPLCWGERGPFNLTNTQFPAWTGTCGREWHADETRTITTTTRNVSNPWSVAIRDLRHTWSVSASIWLSHH